MQERSPLQCKVLLLGAFIQRGNARMLVEVKRVFLFDALQ
jgi:hypothetical protein